MRSKYWTVTRCGLAAAVGLLRVVTKTKICYKGVCGHHTNPYRFNNINTGKYLFKETNKEERKMMLQKCTLLTCKCFVV